MIRRPDYDYVIELIRRIRLPTATDQQRDFYNQYQKSSLVPSGKSLVRTPVTKAADHEQQRSGNQHDRSRSLWGGETGRSSNQAFQPHRFTSYERDAHGGGGGSNEPQDTLPLPSDLRDRVASVVNNPNSDCAEFIKRLISQAEDIKGKAFSNNPRALFDRIQSQAGFKLKKTGYGGLSGREGNSRVIYINPGTASGDRRIDNHSQNTYAVTALNELMHHARSSDFYSDRTLAQAIFKLLTPGEQQANPLPRSRDADTNSRYFHPLFTMHCHSTTGQ